MRIDIQVKHLNIWLRHIIWHFSASNNAIAAMVYVRHFSASNNAIAAMIYGRHFGASNNAIAAMMTIPILP